VRQYTVGYPIPSDSVKSIQYLWFVVLQINPIWCFWIFILRRMDFAATTLLRPTFHSNDSNNTFSFKVWNF